MIGGILERFQSGDCKGKRPTEGIVQKNKNPDPRSRTGVLLMHVVSLLWGEVLVKAQTHDVLEHGSSGRQVGRVKELCVEEIVPVRSSIDRVATLKYASVVLRIVHADERTGIVYRCTVRAPILEIAEKIVHTAIGAEILPAES